MRAIEIREADPQKTSEACARCLTKTFRLGIAQLARVPNSYLLTLKTSVERQIRTSSVQQAIQTIRNRVDQLGVAEPVIQEHGHSQRKYQILVQFPGVDDPARVKEIIKSTALLELKIVEPGGGPFTPRGGAFANSVGRSRKGRSCFPRSENSMMPLKPSEEWYLVNKVASITGRDLKTARESTRRIWQTSSQLQFDFRWCEPVWRVTEENIGKQLAIVLDGKVQSAPSIKGQISDSGQISWQFYARTGE